MRLNKNVLRKIFDAILHFLLECDSECSPKLQKRTKNFSFCPEKKNCRTEEPFRSI